MREKKINFDFGNDYPYLGSTFRFLLPSPLLLFCHPREDRDPGNLIILDSRLRGNDNILMEMTAVTSPNAEKLLSENHHVRLMKDVGMRNMQS